MSSVNKRRNFLKKSATGVVIASLPAKSVWGACSVSGALSGNLSTNADRHTCHMPDLHGGRSPGNWKTWKNNLHDTFLQLKEVKNSVSGHGNPFNNPTYIAAKNCYEDAIEEVMGHTLVLPSEFNPLTLTVEQALATNGMGMNNIYYHMAAVYLNAYFGFYTNYSGQAAANEVIVEVYLYWYINNTYGNGVSISDSELGYNNGSTWWAVESC